MARTGSNRLARYAGGVAAVAMVLSVLAFPGSVGASPRSAGDAFYHYSGSTPLQNIAPGTVLKTRTLPYHVAGLALPLQATQLLYRSTGQLGQPTVNVTSVVRPLIGLRTDRAVSYQSFYDSLNPADEPSVSIAGGVTLGGLLPDVELALFGPFLLQGYSVIVPDSEGQQADFAAGPEYGMNTLDSIRAASFSAVTGLTPRTRIGLIGYSGGAIATNWAAALAPSYAPDVNTRLVGAAEGGVLVDPVHNLHYIDGSWVWAGVMPMAIIGVSRAFHIDLTPYLSATGLALYTSMQSASIATELGTHPGLTWAQLAKPAYQRPEDIPVFVQTVNALNLASAATPTVPMFIGQGANGILEGTPGDKPGIGPGDGVMIAGDVRSLARQYCSQGARIDYQQYDLLSHTTSVAIWLPAAISWLDGRFAALPAPSNCSTIPPGNPLTPIPTH